MNPKNNKRTVVLIFLTLSVMICFPGCSGKQDDEQGLKDHYWDYFTMGVAVAPSSITGNQSELILKHFASITAENVMKPELIHPQEKTYSFSNADNIVDYALQHRIKMRGHTLVWHKQTPDWFFKDESGNPADRELALARLKEHITTVVGRYRGKIYAWDVVNEAVDDGVEFYRKTDWFNICGNGYIDSAFRWAHEADPEAKLFYNDYNTENPDKREKIIRMLNSLVDRGVPVHGIGLQGHWSNYYPLEKQLGQSLDDYSKLGLDIQITELDVSVYKDSHNDPDDDAFTPEREELQRAQYGMIFKVLRDYKNVISAVTFWNVSDKSSWLDNFPVKGRKNYPLLFDENLKPKRVYYEVIKW